MENRFSVRTAVIMVASNNDVGRDMPFGATLTYKQDSKSQRKGRGAFYTPDVLAQSLVEGAISQKCSSVFEPSCGEACFLKHAWRRLVDLGASAVEASGQLFGCELHEASAQAAREGLRAHGMGARISTGDFFDYVAPKPMDAIVGNPPYIRYQDFAGESRDKALARCEGYGVHLSSLCSSWAPFLVVCVSMLAQGGSLGMVLPAELLSVGYAAPVRRLLIESFASLDITMFEERVFPEVQEEVILLLARGKGSSCGGRVTLHRRRGLGTDDVQPGCEVMVPADGSRWTVLLGTGPVRESLSHDSFCRLADWGRVSLGTVTGDNGFFTLSESKRAELGISLRHVHPLIPPGSKHLRALSYGEAQAQSSRAAHQATWIFYPDEGTLDGDVLAYIAYGETKGVSRRYKCRVRAPWWRVPLPKQPADLLFTYMNDVTPQLCTNAEGRCHLNSVHGVALKEEVRELGRELLPLAALNSVTALSAEMEGRQYGGGLLKMEPREAAALKVPVPEVVRAYASDLRAAKGDARALLQAGRVEQATELVDAILLGRAEGMSLDDIAALQSAVRALRSRRKARAKKPVLH